MNTHIISGLALVVALLALLRALLDHRLARRKISELQQRSAEVEHALKQRGRLASEIAHDIKNPITAILCSAETLDLLIGKNLDEAHRRSLLYIREYGEHLLHLVSDFIDVSRADSGDIHARPEPTPVLPTIESVLGLLEANAIKKKISLHSSAMSPDLTALVDPKHLKQIVFNLAHNAIKFTPVGGEVQVMIRSAFPQPFVQISVRDNGVGMAPATIKTLFDPYSREDNQGKSPEAGTGLGLALCKVLVDLGGGQISVHSEPGVGSSFDVLLPIYMSSEQRRRSGSYRAESASLKVPMVMFKDQEGLPLGGQRFLLIDGDSGAREAVSDLIRAWGGIVDAVDKSREALEAVSRQAYDAILLDDTSDGVKAEDLAGNLRHDLGQNATIIIASRLPFDRARLENSRADCWLEKPLNGRSILNSLAESGKYSLSH